MDTALGLCYTEQLVIKSLFLLKSTYRFIDLSRSQSHDLYDAIFVNFIIFFPYY